MATKQRERATTPTEREQSRACSVDPETLKKKTGLDDRTIARIRGRLPVLRASIKLAMLAVDAILAERAAQKGAA